MINNSKKILKNINISYKEIAALLSITEHQAFNLLSEKSKHNKSLYNYLAITYVSKHKIEDLWKLDEEEINKIENRIKKIKDLKE